MGGGGVGWGWRGGGVGGGGVGVGWGDHLLRHSLRTKPALDTPNTSKVDVRQVSLEPIAGVQYPPSNHGKLMGFGRRKLSKGCE